MYDCTKSNNARSQQDFVLLCRWNVIDAQSSIVTQRRKDPRVVAGPCSGVYAILVVRVGLDQTVRGGAAVILA